MREALLSGGAITWVGRAVAKCTAEVRLPDRASISRGGSIVSPTALVGTTKNRLPSSVAAPVTIVSQASAPVTQGQRPSSRQPSSSWAATSAGRPRCCRLVVSWESPTVVNVAPLASGGSSYAGNHETGC